jgi:hypothetical protein
LAGPIFVPRGSRRSSSFGLVPLKSAENTTMARSVTATMRRRTTAWPRKPKVLPIHGDTPDCARKTC